MGNWSKKAKSESKGAPLWIVTFSDLMTLLLTFFVLLLSFSAIQMDDFRAAMGSLKEALGVFQGSQSVMYAPHDITSTIPTKAEILKSTGEVREFLRKNKLEKMVEMELTGEGIRFNLNSTLLFGSGEAVLSIEASDLLESIGYLINRFASHVIVEGHTDDLPFARGKFASNWDLSAARAISVLNFLSSLDKAKSGLFHAAAYSQYKPRVPNDSAYNRSINRRVEIMIKLHDPPKNYTDKEIDMLLKFIEPENTEKGFADTLRSY